MVFVVRLLKVTVANPLPPSEVLQSIVTLLELGCCASALVPGEQTNVAANAVMTNTVGRFIGVLLSPFGGAMTWVTS